jgi:hypothetical protein
MDELICRSEEFQKCSSDLFYFLKYFDLNEVELDILKNIDNVSYFNGSRHTITPFSIYILWNILFHVKHHALVFSDISYVFGEKIKELVSKLPEEIGNKCSIAKLTRSSRQHVIMSFDNESRITFTNNEYALRGIRYSSAVIYSEKRTNNVENIVPMVAATLQVFDILIAQDGDNLVLYSKTLFYDVGHRKIYVSTPKDNNPKKVPKF